MDTRHFLMAACYLLAMPGAFAGQITNSLPDGDGSYAAWDTTPNAYQQVNQGVGCVDGDTSFWERNIADGEASLRQSTTIDISAVPDGARITSVSISVCYGRPTSDLGGGTFKTFAQFDSNSPIDALANLVVPIVLPPPASSPENPRASAQTITLGTGVIKGNASTLQIGVVKESQGSATTRRAVRVYTLAAATVEYQDPVTLNVVKLATSSSPSFGSTAFAFAVTPDPVTPPAAFNLEVDSGTPTDSYQTTLSPGLEYRITEGANPANWNLTEIACQGVTGPQVDLPGRSVSINPATGDNAITCTFTNRYTAPAPPPVAAIPTLGGPGLIALAIGLAGLAASARRRRRSG